VDVFDLRERLVRDYASYVRSFINIRDKRIGDTVERKLKEGALWPDPLVQLNPSFEGGAPIPEIVARGLLHEECEKVFALKSPPNGEPSQPLLLHRFVTSKNEIAKTIELTTFFILVKIKFNIWGTCPFILNPQIILI
jgi:hypothetical protein